MEREIKGRSLRTTPHQFTFESHCRNEKFVEANNIV